MSKEQRLNSLVDESFAEFNVSEKEAFDCYRRMEKPTAPAVAEHFTQLGRNLSSSKVKKWAAKGNWALRIDLSSAISVNNPATAAGELARLGSEPTEQLMRGLAHRLMRRLAVVMPALEVRDIADFARLQNLAVELVKPCSPAGSEADKSSERVYFAPFVTAERE